MLNKWIVYVVYALEWICIAAGKLMNILDRGWWCGIVLGLDAGLDTKFKKEFPGVSVPAIHFNLFVVCAFILKEGLKL